MAFSPDGRWLAAGGGGGGIALWDAVSYRPAPAQKQTLKHDIYSLVFSWDSRWLFVGCVGGQVQRLGIEPSGRLVGSWSYSAAVGVFSVALSRDGKTLAAGRQNGTMEVCEAVSGRLIKRWQAHEDCVNGLAFSPNGRYLASGSWDNTIRLWNVGTWKQEGKPIIGHTSKITCVAFSRDGKWLASGAAHEVKLWDPWHQEENPHGWQTQAPRGWLPYQYGSFFFAPDGALRQLICNEKTNRVTEWDCVARRETSVWPAPNPSAAALSPDGKTLAIGTGDGKAILWDVVAGRQKALLPVDGRSNHTVMSLAFSPDGKALSAASGDPALVTLWDIASRRQVGHFLHSNGAQGIAFSPDGKTLAIANWQGFVFLWDFVAHPFDFPANKLPRWRAHTKAVLDVAFSRDGRTLATSSDDGTVKLWNVATQREMVTLQGHTGPVTHLAFSPDGNTLASQSNDKTILLWRASSLAEADGKGP